MDHRFVHIKHPVAADLSFFGIRRSGLCGADTDQITGVQTMSFVRDNPELRVSHDLAALPEKFAPLVAILDNFRGARTDIDHFVGELLGRLEEIEQQPTGVAAQAEQVEQLQQQLESAASASKSEAQEQSERFARQKQELQTELDTVRVRAVDLGEKLRETERLAAEERAEWTAELRQMRKLLEQPPVVTPAPVAPAPPQTPVTNTTPTVAMPAVATTPADAVLSNVMAQFELVQQDVQRHRTAG